MIVVTEHLLNKIRHNLPEFDAIALIDSNGNRILLSGKDMEGYQTPERFNFTATHIVVRISTGELLEVNLQYSVHFLLGEKIAPNWIVS